MRPGSFSPWIHFPPDLFAMRPFAVGVSALLCLSKADAFPDRLLDSSQADIVDKVLSLLDPSMGRVALDRSVVESCVATVLAVDTSMITDAEEDGDLEHGCLEERFRRISCHYQRWCGPRFGDYSEVQAPWVVNALLLSQLFVALVIGTFLGTGGLYYARIFSVSAFAFGLSMGCGELLGMCISSMLPKMRTTRGSASCHKAAANQALPWRQISLIIFVMLALSTVVALFSAARGLVAAVALQLSFQVLNDVWTYLVNEAIYTMTPSPQYRRLQGHGQMYRRCGNAVAGVMGPFLLSVWAPLPFLMVSALLACWTVLLGLVVGLALQKRETSPVKPAGPATTSAPAILAAIHMFNALSTKHKGSPHGMGACRRFKRVACRV